MIINKRSEIKNDSGSSFRPLWVAHTVLCSLAYVYSKTHSLGLDLWQRKAVLIFVYKIRCAWWVMQDEVGLSHWLYSRWTSCGLQVFWQSAWTVSDFVGLLMQTKGEKAPRIRKQVREGFLQLSTLTSAWHPIVLCGSYFRFVDLTVVWPLCDHNCLIEPMHCCGISW